MTTVGFTGGLLSIASPTSTPAITVAGTSGGIPYFASASAWASSAPLTATAVVKGGGAGQAPVGSGCLIDSSNNLSCPGSVTAGSGSGVTGASLFTGSTSGVFTESVNNAAGTWTFLWPATAGSSGQVLTTDGTGIGSWSRPAASSLILTSGSNQRAGSGTLSSGTLAVANTSVTANSKVFVQDTTSGALTNVGTLVVVSKTAGVGFTVTSSIAIDTSTFDYFIVEQQ